MERKNNFHGLLGAVIFIWFITSAASQCTWPAPFASSTWRSNARGSLVFGSTTMSGWSFTVKTEVIAEWQCASIDEFESDGYLLLRSVQDFIQFVTSRYYAYLCLKLTAITDVSYRVYVQEPKQPNLDNDRYLIHTSAGLTTSASICYEAYGALGSEYHVLVKSGSESSASITCPWIFLGRFDYSHKAVGGTTTCASPGDNWDLCTDKTRMAFDFTTCSTDVPYSGQSDVHCVDTVPVGDDAVVTVYTSATVDDTTTFSFACFALSSGLQEASVAPEFCREGQTSSSYPVDKYGAVIGATLAVTDIYELCPTCPTLTNPDGGSVTVTTDGPWTVAEYTCADNYALYGDMTRICQQNNTWSGATPTCMCLAPASPANGTVTVSDDGSLATYTCLVGFVLRGNEVRVCQTDGNAWNGTDPTCETCNQVVSPANGTVTTSQLGSTTEATFTCDVGFTLDGAASITCLVNGTWSSDNPTCVLCSTLTTPALGNITLTTDGLSSVASFACMSGYQVHDERVLVCDTTGAWNGTEPSCICGTPTAPTSGSVTVSPDGMMSTYSCSVGYTLAGAQTSTCLLDGSSWDNQAPTCVACTNLTTPLGGNLTMSTNGTVTMATYTCDSGYNLAGMASLSCDTSGSWSDSPATCVSCQTLSSPASGNVTMTTDGSVSTASYTCQTGYVLTGDPLRECQSDGTWNGTQPKCDCEVRSAPVNGGVTVAGGVATFSCDVNFTLAGEAVSGCGTDGTGWNTSQPICVQCGYLQSPSGGNVQFASPDGLYTEAVYTCNTNYTMSGSAYVTCRTDGSWDSTNTTCVECETFQSLKNGIGSITSDGQTSMAVFTCDVGSCLGEGNTSAAVCWTNDSWTQEVLTDNQIAWTLDETSSHLMSHPGSMLFAFECKTMPTVPNGSISVTSNGQTSIAVFTCEVGFSLGERITPAAVCGIDGSWTQEVLTDRQTAWTQHWTPSYLVSHPGSMLFAFECEIMPTVPNGSVSVTSDGQTSMAVFTCDIGFSLGEGNTPAAVCGADGSWTQDTATCTECAPLANVSSGNVTVATNGTVTMATYSCMTSYHLIGTQTRLCLTDGSWTDTKPECVCDPPGTLANGSVSVSMDGLTATYLCYAGFTMDGTATSTCGLDGSGWNSQPPTCVTCKSLPDTTTGNLVLTTDGVTTVATYTCSIGYSVNGSSVRSCQTDGSWTGQPPNCVMCANLTSPDSGSYNLLYNMTTTQALFDCGPGYSLVGPDLLTCLQDGNWDYQPPTCVCEAPTPPANGSVSVLGNGYTVVFSCDTGYTLNGSSTSACQTHGQGWSGEPPNCVGCAALPSDSGSNMTLSSNGTVTQLQYSCKVGFSLDGEPTQECNTDGTWSGGNTSCTACATLTDPASGSVTQFTNGTTTMATYSCSMGYYLHGENMSECGSDGTWSSLQPTCVCIPPAVPTNGSMTVSDDNVTLTFTCDAGFILSGSSVRTCKIDGSGWSGSQPSCTTCASVSAPDNGTVTLTSDGTTTLAQFSCNHGYSLDGVAMLTCQEDGTWDTLAPVCVGCPDVGDVASGSVTVRTNSTTSKATFTCVDGYSVLGSLVLTCLTTGQWDNDIPTCLCDAPIAPANGSVSLSQDGREASYQCVTGSTLSGPASRQCGTDGSGWTGTDPLCESCPDVSSPSRGSVNTTSDGQHTYAVFTCDLGYSISGASTLTCTDTGIWDNDVPTCAQCPVLSSPASGSLVTTTDGTVTTANISCVSDYYLSGNSILTCLPDGTWDATSPTCVCDPPSTPASGAYQLSADGMTLTYTCDTGYSLLGVATRQCKTDGSGWNEEQPSCTTCDALTSLVGGDITMVTTGTATQATFTCDAGYTIVGDTELSCRSDGTWDISPPTCAICASLASPNGGSVVVTTDGVISMATYTCAIGYTLNGPQTLTCRTDGSWDLTPPSCVYCPPLTDPDSGMVAMATNGTTTMAFFSCVEGYHVMGDANMTCGNDGNWKTDSPSCVCEPPAAPANGSVTLSASLLEATFTCDVGSSLVGPQTSVCASNGTGWSADIPSCVSCPDLSSVEGGSVKTLTNGTTTSSSVTCSLGSSVSGSTTILCGNDGAWSDSQPACVECPTVTSPDHGGVSLKTDGAVTVASYSCDLGYTLSGESHATCLTVGSWDNPAPTCVLCDSLAGIPSGTVVTILDDTGTVTMATYSCVAGYFLSGDQTTVCLEDGNWNSSQSQCVCNQAEAPANGSVWTSPDGMSTVFSCDEGFTISGNIDNTCTTNGTGWLHPHPTCVECRPAVTPLHGNTSLYTDGTTTYIVYSCEAGYSFSSTVAIATCGETGQWDQTSLYCVKCISLDDPDSGTVYISTNGTTSQADYSCLHGYRLQGNSQRACLTDGTWSGTDPTCVCTIPTTPTNGAVNISDHQLTATYTCDTGYTLAGVSVRHCRSDGTGWTNTEPTCAICETLPSVVGGTVSLSNNGESTLAQVTCEAGYTMRGSPDLQCRSDGTWNISTPQCELCDLVTASSSGSYSLSTDGQTTSVTFTCDTGYSLSGSSTAMCTTAGTWTQPEPSCVSCSTLGSPASGTMSQVSNGTVTIATFQCVSGYYILGESVLYCDDTGAWSDLEPTCVCVAPQALANGTVSLQDGGNTAVYTCTEGYSLTGSQTHTCSTRGAGWNGTEPSCVQCDELSAPANGTLVSSTDGSTTSLQVSCDVGYTATGPVTLTCQSDGTYDSTIPECAECSAVQAPINGTVALSSTGSETLATFSCDLGHTLAGNQLLSCLADGFWSAAEPTCAPCASFPSIASGVSSLTTNGTITTASVQCVSRYYLHGPATVFCTQDGNWTEMPTCLCESPSSPANGQVTADGSQATFTCDVGYSLDGDANATCMTDGSGWDNATPTCVLCESQSTIAIGTSLTSTDGSTTSTSYSCPVGHTLDGESTLTCRSDGTWSGQVPSCSPCESLVAPGSGSVTMETDNTTTTAMFTCASGYDLLGNLGSTCLANGTWDTDTPTCACSIPNAPLNGDVTVSSDWTTVTYGCIAGYTLTGVTTRTCQDGSAGWTGEAPTCTVCSTLSTPSGGNVAMTTGGTMTTATFSCDIGYTLDGETTLACRDDGSWNTSAPNCVLCENLEPVSGGHYILITDSQVTSVQYSCTEGATLTGVQQLTCLTSGQWSGQPPVCTSCPVLADPDSGKVDTSTNGSTTTATFSCVAGYQLYGQSDLTCLTSGQWDSNTPKCLCSLPNNITSGSYTISNDGSAVTYSCQPGYTLDGALTRTCQQAGLGWTGIQPSCVQCQELGSIDGGTIVTVTNGSVTTTDFQCDAGATLYGETTLECTSNGTWSQETPTCVFCPVLVAPDNGTVTMATNGTVTTGTYGCDVGYSMDGAKTIYCQTDGAWSAIQPTCSLCQTLAPISSGSISLALSGRSTTATYSCVYGYQLVGASLLTCRSDGTWDSASPTCVCEPPLSLVSGNYTISSDGLSLTYSCDLGYTMTGSADRSCDTAGAGWSGSTPTCVQCESLTEPANGAVSYITDGLQTIVKYSCETGFAISDVKAVTATCTDGGTWNISANTTVSCVSCPTLDPLANGNVSLTTEGSYTMASYECLPDYSLSGLQQRMCVQGTWNGTDPKCLCSYSTYLENGLATSNGSVISYQCDPGYSLAGPSSRVCQDAGLGWSLTEPSCVVCESLSVPVGGNLTLTSDGLVTMATFTCDLGYSMTGQASLICRTDGTWSTSPPSCGSACSALSLPIGGDVTLATTGQVTTAEFTCDVKYSLVGAQTLTCRSDGSWDFTQPSCVFCGDLSSPASGYVTLSTDGTTSVADYSCHGDYYLQGTSQASCMTSGVWGAAPPSCICVTPLPVANGSVDITDDGVVAKFSCADGYTLSGNSSTTCQTNYTGWAPYTINCVTCGDVPELSNTTSVVTSDGQVTSVTFTCDLGYTLSGDTFVSCTDSGSWDTGFPTCVSCPAVEMVQNSSQTLATDGITTTAQFTCDIGFSLSGASLLTCSTEGSWSDPTPECVYCPPVITPVSGSRLESTDGITSLVTFTCDSGYHLVGDTTLACQTDATWNGSQPVCVCDTPAAPANGSVLVSSDGMTSTYTCDQGFTLDGQTSRQCSNDSGGWQGIAPNCVECAALSSLGDGSYSLSSDGLTTVVSFSCQAGYTISGPDQITCGSDGSWEDTQPACTSCDVLDNPANGHVTIATNGTVSTATYSCDTGYQLQGQTERVCSELGTWGGTQPICLCESPEDPVNGEVSSNGITATFLCDLGYTLYGEPTRTCQNNNQGWSGLQPNCTICSSLSPVSGGTVAMVTDGTMTSAVYSCSEGYTVSGSSTITCRDDGSWDFTETSCVPCETLSIPNHGRISLNTDSVTTTASVTCDVGYTLSGASQLACRADGSWDFSVPTCVACAALPAPDSGYVNVSTDGLASVAQYSCVSSYHSDGGTTRTCDTDGGWSGTEPTCRCDSPATPTNGSLSLSADEGVAVFTCNPGYSLTGAAVLLCQSDGAGWNGTEPTCVSCDVFDTSFNGSVTVTTDGVTSVALLTCDLGSTLSGSSSIACQEDGTWMVQSTPRCVTCSTLSSPTGGHVTTETNGTETVALFTCDVGHTMDGEASLYCTDTGEWSGTEPLCAVCSSVEPPTSGNVVLSSDNHTTVAMVTCAAGYHVVGSNPVTCLVDGSWSDELPSCLCDVPTSQANGQSMMSVGGDIVQFSCNAGYTLDGASAATCGTDGSGWDNSVPDCVLCSPLVNITDGYVTVTTNGTTSLAIYNCQPGFSLHGNTHRECTTNGTWTLTEPQCVSCPNLTAPASGYVNVTTSGTISTAQYHCETGYNLQGTDMRQCQTDGTWTNSQPACECQLPLSPDNGAISYGGDVSVAIYSCSVGYSLQGATQRYCQTDGTGWNNTAPTCVACITLSSSAGAVTNPTTDGATTSVLYACDLGYTLAGAANLTCRDDGTWDTQPPTCVSCTSLSTPAGGEVAMATDGSVTQAYVTCDKGRTLVGASLLTCRADGSWDFLVPTCVQCPSLSSPFGGTVTLATDGLTTTAMYTCLSAYYLEGVSDLTCGETGNWSDTEPVCKCNAAAAIPNGDYQLSANGYMVTYTCNAGYSLTGDSNLTCLDGGAGWSGDPPTCFQCEPLSTPANGSYTVTTDGQTTSVTFTCISGSTLLGQAESSCQADGSWQFTEPVCVSCASLAPPDNGLLEQGTNGTVSEAAYTCDLGYTLQGAPLLTCKEDGSWSDTPPTCVNCLTLATPSNGAVVMTTNGTVTIATFSCNVGYSVVGSQLLTCTAAGSWDTSAPECACDFFTVPANGELLVTNNGSKGVYSCEVGYSLVGEAEQECVTPNTANNTTPPTCVACATLPDVPGSSITMTTDGAATYTTVVCGMGYTISGHNNLTCRSDGTWDFEVPACAVCDTLTVPEAGMIQLNSNGSVTGANVTCDLGSTLAGAPYLTCRTDGTWDFTTPTCSVCPSVTDPSSGSVTLTSDGHRTQAQYTCVSGYYLDGVAIVTCNTSGDWEADPPTCKCVAPPEIANGTSSVSFDGSIIQYSCELGHSLAGNQVRSCDTGGNWWDGELPDCVQCESLTALASGTVTMTTDGVTTSASFLCETGFTLKGTAGLSCLTDGTWDGDQPTCDKCSELVSPANGTLTYQTNATVTTAQVWCDLGFTANGSTEITCLPGGGWDHTIQECVPCPVSSSPSNGDVTMSTNGSVTIATFSCVSYFDLVGSGQLDCDSGGTWSGETPTCECGVFSQPADGHIMVSENGTVATYSCEAGYSLSGEVSLQCGPADTFLQPTCVRCDTLAASGGSTYSLSTNGSVTMATYSCDTGYTMIGQSPITCLTDGSWDREVPSCVACSTLTPPDGASVNFSTSGETTVAYFTCANGYSLVGADTLTCRTDGTWDVTVPDCVQCPDLVAPAAGHVSMTTDGHTSVADYSCVSGYHLDGATRLTCNTSGLWNSELPACKCDVESVFPNGSIAVSADGYSIFYTCLLGYTLNGTAKRSCDMQGAGWSDKAPVCVACADLSVPANLYIQQHTDGAQTSAVFTCHTGFSMAGSPQSSCLTDGNWSEHVPSCVACVMLEQLANGIVTLSSNGTTSVASYQCDVGFTLAGETTLSCNSSGSWSSATPQCVTCPPVSNITNGQVTLSTNGTVTMATYSCDLGYSVVGYPALQCTTTGSWDQSAPECLCDDFVSVSNGMLSISANGTVATYSCDEGYTMSGTAVVECASSKSTLTVSPPTCTIQITTICHGEVNTMSRATVVTCAPLTSTVAVSPFNCTACESLAVPARSSLTVTTDGETSVATVECDVGYVILGQANLTCRQDGTWDVVMPTCVVCSTLTPPVAGDVSLTTVGSTTIAQFTCDPGYTLSGSNQLTCRTDGSWDLAEPACVACPVLGALSGGSVNLATDGTVSMATFSCVPGYYLDGPLTLTCTESGTWIDQTPVCKCDQLPSISNGYVTFTLDGYLATYSCQLGYSLSGAVNRSCDQSGAGWQGEAPVCVKCEDITPSSNMTVTMTTDSTVSMVTYKCDLGLSLNGAAVSICGTDGAWTQQQPTCDQCADLVAPSTGTLTMGTNGTLSQAQFTCDLGYTMEGESVVTCLPGGAWSDNPPQCELCASVSDPSNGLVAMSTNGTVTMATYSCTPGYSLSGDELLYCDNMGAWSNSPPTCGCDMFVRPGNGNISVNEDGVTAIYNCNLGYTLNTDSTQTCTTDTLDVECVLCETLPTALGSTVHVTTDGSQTRASFSCDVGYKMAGHHALACRTDGTWDIQPPTCVACSNLTSPAGGVVSLSGDGQDTWALFSCIPGFMLTGQHNLTCKTDGGWDFTQPHCVCDSPPVPANGQITVLEDSLTAVYTCDVGYTLQGYSMLYCATDGSGWQGTQPTCVGCPDLMVTHSLSVNLTSDGTTTVAMVTCDHGYSLSNTDNVTCLQNGSWGTDIPTCLSCPEPAATPGLQFELQSDGVSTRADFSCAGGYSLHGATQITCTRNGSWDITQPNCVAASDSGSSDSGGGAGTAVAIVFALLFAICLLLLLLLAWRFWKLKEQLKIANKTDLYRTAPRTEPDGKTSLQSLPELDEIVLTNTTAPIGHQRHVTELGRAPSSLAPSSHRRHNYSAASMMSNSPLLVTPHMGPEMPRPPQGHAHKSGRALVEGGASPNPSFSFSFGQDSNQSTPLPQQILTPRPDTETPQPMSFSKLNLPSVSSNRPSPVNVVKLPSKRKAVRKVRSGRVSEVAVPDIPREGSPLPQQILTPREPDPPAPWAARKKGTGADPSTPWAKRKGAGADRQTDITAAAALADRSKSKSVSPGLHKQLTDVGGDRSLSDC